MSPFAVCSTLTCRDIAKVNGVTYYVAHVAKNIDYATLMMNNLVEAIRAVAMVLLHARHQIVILVDIIIEGGVRVKLIDAILMLYTVIEQGHFQDAQWAKSVSHSVFIHFSAKCNQRLAKGHFAMRGAHDTPTRKAVPYLSA